jgi:hypothetical protein
MYYVFSIPPVHSVEPPDLLFTVFTVAGEALRLLLVTVEPWVPVTALIAYSVVKDRTD